ncbi:hypothetical protein J4407_00660 [Candidatus Pacearchaeota archaeon]|nr:hypothetical protein [Candidatus Pacearchaeota archaeon]
MAVEMSSVGVFVIILIVVVFIVMKVANVKQEIVIKLTLALFLLLTISLTYVYFKTDPDLSSVSGAVEFGKTYFLWFGNAWNNVRTLTSNTLKMDWSYNNKTMTSDT